MNLKSHMIDNCMIMELKYPLNVENDNISNFLKNIPFRLSKNSKYINGLIGFFENQFY